MSFILLLFGQSSLLLSLLLLFVIGIGLFFCMVVSLGVTLILYFIIGSSFFWAALPSSMVIQTEMPFFIMVVWMIGLLLLAILSGLCATRIKAIFHVKEELEEQIRTVVATDAMTGFDNKSRLMFELDAEFSRSKRY